MTVHEKGCPVLKSESKKTREGGGVGPFEILR